VSQGWPLAKVGDLFDVQLGKMLSPKAKEGEQFPYLANFNVQWGKFNLENLNTMNFSEREKQKYSLEKGDILVCEGGEAGRCAIWEGQIENCFY
jgi:type I restriction enzyme S subunit